MHMHRPSTAETRRRYWRKTLSLTTGLLAIWFLVSFVATYFARDLNFDFFGWPFSFWLAAQGAPLIYVLLVGFYARAMNRLDVAHGQDDEAD
jgi:putative solute:sodium symporter small subunit